MNWFLIVLFLGLMGALGKIMKLENRLEEIEDWKELKESGYEDEESRQIAEECGENLEYYAEQEKKRGKKK